MLLELLLKLYQKLLLLNLLKVLLLMRLGLSLGDILHIRIIILLEIRLALV
jgi:hypothetical protein